MKRFAGAPALVDVSLLHRMCDAIEHRGPDSRGAHFYAEREGVLTLASELTVLEPAEAARHGRTDAWRTARAARRGEAARP